MPKRVLLIFFSQHVLLIFFSQRLLIFSSHVCSLRRVNRLKAKR
jgi:hypothetical protein